MAATAGRLRVAGGVKMRQKGIICRMAAIANPKSTLVESAKNEPLPASAAEPETAQKLCALEARLGQLGSLMVAYSGGVDSAFLAATAHRVLGDRMLAVLADSPSLARRDMEQASAFARAQEMPLHVIATEEL
jgi:asparagine synthetase B (glutamine-hydrolysing)